MADEIKRNRWSQFLKKFTIANQYRYSTVVVARGGNEEIQINQDAPFLGVAVSKAGRYIDGVNFFSGRYDLEKISEPVVSIKGPVKLEVEKDDSGHYHNLAVHAEDGTVAKVILRGENSGDGFRSYVEKVAYKIAENRGFAPGNDTEDWLEAERRVKEAELALS